MVIHPIMENTKWDVSELSIGEALTIIDSIGHKGEVQGYYSWSYDLVHKKTKGDKMNNSDYTPGSHGGQSIDKDHWALKDAKSYERFLMTNRGFSNFKTVHKSR